MIYVYISQHSNLPYLVTDNTKSYYTTDRLLVSTIRDILDNERGWSSILEDSDDRAIFICSFDTIDEFKIKYPEFFI